MGGRLPPYPYLYATFREETGLLGPLVQIVLEYAASDLTSPIVSGTRCAEGDKGHVQVLRLTNMCGREEISALPVESRELKTRVQHLMVVRNGGGPACVVVHGTRVVEGKSVTDSWCYVADPLLAPADRWSALHTPITQIFTDGRVVYGADASVVCLWNVDARTWEPCMPRNKSLWPPYNEGQPLLLPFRDEWCFRGFMVWLSGYWLTWWSPQLRTGDYSMWHLPVRTTLIGLHMQPIATRSPFNLPSATCYAFVTEHAPSGNYARVFDRTLTAISKPTLENLTAVDDRGIEPQPIIGIGTH
jgi:hypothetical protein